MDKQTLLGKLPSFDGRYQLINSDQSVRDIIKEVQDAHKVFAGHYEKIALCFDADTTNQVCDNLYKFCKRNFVYDEQDEDNQATMSPAAMITLRKVDCKNYAGFCGGVLDALNRLTQRKINWCYRFASYRVFDSEPHHVFVVVNPGQNEIWIDPTPGASQKTPIWQKDKTLNMALHRISGTSEKKSVGNYAVSDLLDTLPTASETYMAVQTLLKYGVMNVNAKINDSLLESILPKMPFEDQQKLINARAQVQKAAIGGFFSDIWNGVKSVTLSLPRNAYLGLVRLNAFGYATKLFNAIWKDESATTYYQPGQDQIYRKWHSLGGHWNALADAVKAGYKKKAILGNTIGVAPAIPPWVATAGAVIALITPLLKEVLKARQQQTGINYDVDPLTGMPYGMAGQTPDYSSGGIMSFVENNPLVVIGAAVAIVYVMKNKS